MKKKLQICVRVETRWWKDVSPFSYIHNFFSNFSSTNIDPIESSYFVSIKILPKSLNVFNWSPFVLVGTVLYQVFVCDVNLQYYIVQQVRRGLIKKIEVYGWRTLILRNMKKKLRIYVALKHWTAMWIRVCFLKGRGGFLLFFGLFLSKTWVLFCYCFSFTVS